MIAAVRRHGMIEQTLIKTPADPRYLRMVEEVAPDCQYMTMIHRQDESRTLLERMNTRHVGAEVDGYTAGIYDTPEIPRKSGAACHM